MKVVFGLLLTTLVGCREVHYYAFKFVEAELLGNSLNVDVIGSYGEDYEKSGNKHLDWGFPYYLQITYVVPTGSDLFGMEVKILI